MEQSNEIGIKQVQEFIKRNVVRENKKSWIKSKKNYLNIKNSVKNIQQKHKDIQQKYQLDQDTFKNQLIKKFTTLKILLDDERNSTEQMLIQKQSLFDKCIQWKGEEIGDLNTQLEQLRKHINELKEIYQQNKEKFHQFKVLSQKIIKKYIDLNEKAQQKILQVEVSKVNFSSEEIKRTNLQCRSIIDRIIRQSTTSGLIESFRIYSI
ncbi:unnamed protein product (macronuclear) [Paramecium tetraurelia]|uniref:Uncharacterized protein n=1 Tax=Paramecium tetraurelia TaxID=5888 RepID=A0D9M2_PARTE|nr:uncharacterized protein GSPATT00014669001 [Paramecium tetraurelia]CAK79739.1 unnamed protein product [Paramecium tetraurelia]|eukprot:XP_001447136.1 hypothetical protein (macronuclear) [Paramecium tetraurelia strain d4-2]